MGLSNTIINGVQVTSDKQVTSIHNSRVNFSDGSWCDVATGEVVNRGPGYITLGNGSDKSGNGNDTVTLDEQRFRLTTNRVRFDSVPASIDVQVHDGPDVVVQLSGIESELQTITTKLERDALVISGAANSGGASIQISGSSFNIGSFFSRGGTNIVMGSSNASSPNRVQVKVPVGTAIELNGIITGDSVIGDTHGPLNINLTGGSDVNAGKVATANIGLLGSGDVEIEHVDGDLRVSVQGSGDVDVNDGSIGLLMVDVMGSGDVQVHGTAQQADLRVMGSGDITVDHVVKEPRKSALGSGRIRVHRIG